MVVHCDGGYDKRFVLSYPRDFLTRVQMVSRVSFAFTPNAGVGMVNPGGTRQERDDFLLAHVARAGTVREINVEMDKMSAES